MTRPSELGSRRADSLLKILTIPLPYMVHPYKAVFLRLGLKFLSSATNPSKPWPGPPSCPSLQDAPRELSKNGGFCQNGSTITPPQPATNTGGTFSFPPQQELSGRSPYVESIKVAASPSFLPQSIASKMSHWNCQKNGSTRTSRLRSSCL